MPSAEDDLIDRHFAPIAGPGGLGLADDAGLISVPDGCELVVTTDGVSAGRHFLDDPPESVARKALRVNLSDLAAKGADPLGFTLTLAMPMQWDDLERETFLAAFARALGEDARHYACPLIGGDTISIDGPLTLSITAFGAVPAGRMARRTGAREGDLAIVSGTIGDAAIGLRLRERAGGDDAQREKLLAALSFEAREFLLDRYAHPQPRAALAHALRTHAHAAMDISDGFVGDIVKMLRASGVGGLIDAAAAPLSDAARAAIAVDEDLHRVALAGGDDYEIAATCAEEAFPMLDALGRAAGAPFTIVGRVGAQGEAVRVAPPFEDLLARGSFSHF